MKSGPNLNYTNNLNKNLNLAPRPGRRRGRPEARDPLSYVFYIRLTEGDGRSLDDAAERLDRGRGELAREILLAGLAQLEMGSL